MEFGKLRHRLVIQRRVETRDAIGGISARWATLATRWGSVEPLTGRELTYAQQVEALVTHRIEMRYFPNLAPTYRLKYGDRVFQIESVVNPGEIGATMTLLCTETTEEPTATSTATGTETE